MKKTLYCTLVLLTCIFLSACKNDTTNIGYDLLGNLVDTEFTDTITLQAYSILEDTINTTGTSAHILGHLSDPTFGNSSAGIYTELALGGGSVSFGSSPAIDSVVLTLQLSSYYGDTTSAVGIRVHQLTESMDQSTTYYQTSKLGYDPTPLNYQLTGYTIQPNTAIVIDTSIYAAHLRIRLSQQFGQYLLNHESDLNNRLSDFLKGLYIEAVSHTGPYGYMLITNMTSSLTGLTLYYHNSDAQGMRYTLSCTDKCARFTHIDHDYNASQDQNFISEVLHHQTDIGNDVLFVQGGGGVKTRISFPYLEHAFEQFDNRVVIHRAELVISNADRTEKILTPSTALTIQGIGKSDSSIRFLPDDDYYTNSSYYGGVYDVNNNEYRFRITKYVQELVLGEGDWCPDINLIVRGSAVRPSRLVFHGTDPDSPLRMRLEIAYSTY